MQITLPVVFGLALLAAGCARDDATLPEEPASRVGYSIGYQIGGDFRQQGVDISPEFVLRGVEDAMAGDKPRMQVEEMQSALVALQRRIKAEGRAMPQDRPAGAAGGPVDAESFMAANARQPGVETLPSGLQYKVLEQGAGDSPGAEDTVTVHYRGSLTDGSEFDSSYRRGQPATFAVNRVIAGWTEALQLMREGDKWQLFIPPGLAYGERGAGSRIPPNSALVFEVELIEVN